jgi:hypothetical protein
MGEGHIKLRQPDAVPAEREATAELDDGVHPHDWATPEGVVAVNKI